MTKRTDETPLHQDEDGISRPLPARKSSADDPIDVGTAPAFPPDQAIAPSTIGSVAETAATSGPIGSASTTCENLSEVAPNPGE
jgi:hypothetical protein